MVLEICLQKTQESTTKSPVLLAFVVAHIDHLQLADQQKIPCAEQTF